MSDLMLHGVLNMPMPDDPSELDLVTWVQFRDRARQASARIEQLEAQERKSRGYRVGHIAGYHAAIRDAAEMVNRNLGKPAHHAHAAILALINKEPKP